MCVWRGKRNWEERFPHQNWVIILGMIIVNNTAYSVLTPSIYQFITTPRSIPEELENEADSGRFWPGLGGSDSQYAWTLVAYSIGESFFSLVAGLMIERCPYIFIQVVAIVMHVLGGVVYALSTEVWMVIVARLVIGTAAGIGGLIVHTYTGEMSTRMDDIRRRQGKRPMKHVVYILFSFLLNGTFIFSFGVNSIMAQFDNINPYHWPGWFVVALALFYIGIALIVFREIRPPPKLKRPKVSVSCHCLTRIKLSTQLQSDWKMQFTIYGYLIVCSYINGQLYSLLATLVTPVLSDQFGFTVEYTSHYLIGVAVALFMASVIQLGIKVFNVDNRKVLGVALMLALVGFVLMGDWQAIGRDPCSLDGNLQLNTSTNSTNSSDLIHGVSVDSVLSSGLMLPPTDELNSTSNSSLYVEQCEALSSSSHQCFWNPKSHITGEFCNTCLPTCLSKQTTINFYQFTVGILLISFATPLWFVLISAMSSDIASVDSQGMVMGLTVSAGAFARAVSPIWFVESYESADRHTYISASVTALSCLLMLLGLVVLYKKLAPRRTPQSSPRKHESTNHVADDVYNLEKVDPDMQIMTDLQLQNVE